MSVWDVPYHLDDALNHAVARIREDPVPQRLLQALASFEVHEVPGFDQGVKPGVLAETLDMTASGLREVYGTIGERYDRTWKNTVGYYERMGVEYECGLRAVYTLCCAGYNRRYDEPQEIDFKEIQFFASRMSYHMYTAGHSAPATRTKVAKVAKDLMRRNTHVRYLFQVAAAFDHMLGIANAGEYSSATRDCNMNHAPAPDTKAVDMNRPVCLGPEVVVRVAAGTVFVEVPTDWGSGHGSGFKVCFLTMKDVKRVCETLNGMAQTLLYPALAKVGNQHYGQRKAIPMVLKHIVDSMESAVNPNNVARFYDVALHTLIAQWGADMDPRPLDKMHQKYEDEKLHEIAKIGPYLKMLSGLDPEEALDAARVYKLLPCPDFNPFEDFAVQAGKQAKKNTWFKAVAEDLTEEKFEQWRKLQALRLVVSSPDSLGSVVVDHEQLVQDLGPDAAVECIDAIIAGRGGDIPVDAVPSLECEGLLPMLGLDAIVPETLKDKSLCPKSVTGKPGDAIDASGTQWECNYLLEHMRTPQPMTADEALTTVATSTKPHYHKVFFKPETKKANARNCYSAQSLCRKALSLVEQSVAHYLRGRRGNANGKPDYQITNSILEAIQGYDNHWLGVSFDISGFSPNMSKHATLSSLRKWAHLFGDHRVGEVHRVLSNGIAVWNHGFIKQSYALAGTDLEGYLGRTNTDFHIDVMTFALSVLQARMKRSTDPEVVKWSNFQANLQVMIDDGLLILKWGADLPNVDQMPGHIFTSISDTIEEAYAACSMKLSWDKTVISSRCMTFLNEVFLDGRHIGNGLRAYIRIRPERGNVPQDAHELANRYVAMAQGAIKSGTPMVAAVIGLGLQLGMEFARNRQMPLKWGSDMADLMMLPTAYGGAALPSITILGASAGGDPFSTSIGNCLRIADAEPRFGGKLLGLVNMEPVPASVLQTLRNPDGVHVGRKQITCTALRTAISKRLPKLTRNVELRVLLRVDLQQDAEDLLASLGDAITSELVSKVYAGSRVHLVDRLLDKFKKASSLSGVLPKRVIRQVERANARALLHSLAAYQRLF